MKDNGIVKLLSDARNLGAVVETRIGVLMIGFPGLWRKIPPLRYPGFRRYFQPAFSGRYPEPVPGMDFATRYVKSIEEGREWLRGRVILRCSIIDLGLIS